MNVSPGPETTLVPSPSGLAGPGFAFNCNYCACAATDLPSVSPSPSDLPMQPILKTCQKEKSFWPHLPSFQRHL